MGDPYTWRNEVRTNIDIDDDLMHEAMRASGERTKRAVVERALRLLVQTRGQARIRRLRGKITWRGDLNESRRARGASTG
jgi:Arc/MetJ family transcription regulator